MWVEIVAEKSWLLLKNGAEFCTVYVITVYVPVRYHLLNHLNIKHCYVVTCLFVCLLRFFMCQNERVKYTSIKRFIFVSVTRPVMENNRSPIRYVGILSKTEEIKSVRCAHSRLYFVLYRPPSGALPCFEDVHWVRISMFETNEFVDACLLCIYFGTTSRNTDRKINYNYYLNYNQNDLTVIDSLSFRFYTLLNGYYKIDIS